MQLPKNILSNTYTKPDVYLCETDKTKICEIDVSELQGTFKFNSYSELSCNVGRTFIDTISGETKVHPFYDKIEALRLLFIPDFGYFEIQAPDISSEGEKEIKEITAYSSEYQLSQKYIENFIINTGEIGSIDRVKLYDVSDAEHSLLDLVLVKMHGTWTIGHVDLSISKMERQFNVDRESIYDFLINEVCDKFHCMIVFDTINNTINVYAESLITKFYGDGVATVFTLSNPYSSIYSVELDGYKTTDYTYNSSTGAITFSSAPTSGQLIEITDGSQSKWDTDVYISFNNLVKSVQVSYNADDIKTVLTVKGANDIGIRDVNFGLPYIVDLSYYYNVEWMGQGLYNAYTTYLNKIAGEQNNFNNKINSLYELYDQESYLENRVSLQYAVAQVTEQTVGTYYLRGGTSPNYYYTEVTLPGDYNINDTYYSISGTNLNKDKLNNLNLALQDYFHTGSTTKIGALADEFVFMNDYYPITTLVYNLNHATSDSQKETFINAFLDEMWKQFGLKELTSWESSYKSLQEIEIKSGWSDVANSNHYIYYTVHLLLQSVQRAIAIRKSEIITVQNEIETTNKEITTIGDDINVENNFTADQLRRLSPFLREDEYTDDSLVITETDTNSDILKTKQELMECGKFEAVKVSQPKLSFSMEMANIYALDEFRPIINQFQLGNMVRVAIRDNYIKRTRIMQVSINFEDFDDFKCEFGDLFSLMSEVDIHADLLSKAATAGKSIASNASYWSKGSDAANSIDAKLQQGLLDATTSIKSIDGRQGVIIDQYGIHLYQYNDDGSLSDKQGWIVNNQFLYSSDGFKTTESVFGEYTIGDKTLWGLLAKCILAGYIEGSTIVGGTINIGNGTFIVDEDGVVTINAGGLKDSVDGLQSDVDNINSQKMYRVELSYSGSNMMTKKNQTSSITCKVYSWDEDITSTLDDSLFTWKRTSDYPDSDLDWNNLASHKGTKTISISTEDVLYHAYFNCEVNLPE